MLDTHVRELKRLALGLLLAALCAARAGAADSADSALQRARLDQLDAINRVRAAAGAPPVRLDPAASEFATLRARQAAEHAYRGHWNLDGYPPWMHWGLLGGMDHINENTHAAWARTTGAPPGPGICDMDDPAMIAAAMKKGLDAFMAEGPGGGHHDNVLDPSHTHVGLGFHCVARADGDTVEYQLRYYEEFVDRYIAFDPVERNPAPGDTVTVTGRVLAPDTGLFAAVVYHAPFPTPMTPEQLNAKSSYLDYTETQAADLWPWDIAFDPETQSFSVPLKLEREGVYYVQLYIKSGVRDISYKTRGRASTRGLPCAGGVVFSVGRTLAAPGKQQSK